MTEEYYREQYRKYLKEYDTLKAQHLIASDDPGAWNYRSFKKNVEIAFSQSPEQIEKDNITERNVYKVIASKQRAFSEKQYEKFRPAIRRWYQLYKDPERRRAEGLLESDWNKIKQYFNSDGSIIGYARNMEQIVATMYALGPDDNFYNYIDS